MISASEDASYTPGNMAIKAMSEMVCRLVLYTENE